MQSIGTQVHNLLEDVLKLIICSCYRIFLSAVLILLVVLIFRAVFVLIVLVVVIREHRSAALARFP